MATDEELESLTRRLSRERRARRDAETIAERSTRELYEVIQDLRRSQGELDNASGLVALLQRAAVAANEASELEEAAATVLGEVCRYMRWPVGHLYVSTGHGEMVPTTVWHLENPERFRVFREVTEASRLPAGVGLPGRVLATGRPAWIADVTKDENFPRATHALDLGVKAAFGFPVVVSDEVAAVLEFFAIESVEPNEPLLEAMAHIGSQLGRVVERRSFERRLQHQALHDPLTGLPNRTLLLDRLRHALTLSRRNDSMTAVLYVDLDRFKAVNDNLGHGSGDQLLLEVAGRLPTALRAGDTFGRLGGDEFVVICEGLSSPDDATLVAERIVRSLTGPFQLSAGEVFIAASVGVAIAHGGEPEAEQLLADADLAMYRAKERGRGRYTIYDESMRSRLTDRIAIENELRHALQRRELTVFYQPIVELEGSTIAGVEALVRWRHPERGLLGPAEFVGVAEETGLILPLGDFVLAEACGQLARWRGAGIGPPSLSMAVNVSIRQLEHAGFVDRVTTALNNAGLDPSALVLEVTESVLMDDVTIVGQLSELRALGVQLAIDDFGTGYSSLDRLRRLPVATLKIDKSFVDELETAPAAEPLVAAMIAMAHRLGLGVIAEGVETEGQLHALRELGCGSAQGYLFSRPVPARTLASRLRLSPGGIFATT